LSWHLLWYDGENEVHRIQRTIFVGLGMVRYLLFLAVLLAFPAFGMAQLRDTVQIHGHTFLFAETTEEDNGEEIQVINLVRVDPLSSKWLLKHTLHAEFPDCNSIEMELGTYVVSDSGVTFYSAWMYTSNALAGVCGFRKQVYAVNPQGRVKPGPTLIWMEVGPMHTCLQGLESDQGAMFDAHPSKLALSERRLFEECMVSEFGGRFVDGGERELLIRETKAALAKEIEAAYEVESERMQFISCD
jgi:hypothetical protein